MSSVLAATTTLRRTAMAPVAVRLVSVHQAIEGGQDGVSTRIQANSADVSPPSMALTRTNRPSTPGAANGAGEGDADDRQDRLGTATKPLNPQLFTHHFYVLHPDVPVLYVRVRIVEGLQEDDPHEAYT